MPIGITERDDLKLIRWEVGEGVADGVGHGFRISVAVQIRSRNQCLNDEAAMRPYGNISIRAHWSRPTGVFRIMDSGVDRWSMSHPIIRRSFPHRSKLRTTDNFRFESAAVVLLVVNSSTSQETRPTIPPTPNGHHLYRLGAALRTA